MIHKNNNLELILVAGASRGIGKAFADYYNSQKNTEVIKISRSNKQDLTQLDLLNEQVVNNFVNNLNLNKIKGIIYIHATGIDKFEPNAKPHIDFDMDGIDDKVYATNVTSFLNLAKPLIKKIKQTKIPMTIYNIGSISDIYEVPFWQSFTKSKNIIRKYSKSIDNLEKMRYLDSNYAEFDFYKHNHNFRSDYFTNLSKLFASWQKDMGFTGKEIPHGIRI